MPSAATIEYSPANLRATAILDFKSSELQELLCNLREPGLSDLSFVQKAHVSLCQTLRPVYSVNEWQPASRTLRKGQGSCSQRMACLEALARAEGIPTRVRALQVKGSFWYPRFKLSRPFIPGRILLVWPQFFLEGIWVDFDELHAPMARLVTDSQGFRNDGESLFEAVRSTPIDFLGKSCGLPCAREDHDLSKYVLTDNGLFDTRDEVFERFGSFQYSLRGRIFELLFAKRGSRSTHRLR